MSNQDDVLRPISGPPPLLWVNHNARSRKSQHHRHAVFTHVQNSYKRWKKQEDVLSLRKAARVSSTRFAQVREAGTDIFPEALQTDKIIVEEDCLERLHTENDAEKEQLHDILEVIASRTKPQTILGKGNSDPFHAFAVPIDARVAHVMAYTSDLYLPGIYRHHNLADRKAASTQAFNEIIAFLHDECTAYPHLARIVAVMPRGSAESISTSQSVMFKTKGLISLRKRLMSPDSLFDPKTSASVLLFLTAELYDGNLEAASFHARILAHILQTGVLPVDFWFLFKALYHDMQRACLSLVRPAFDLETWVPKQFNSVCFTAISRMSDAVICESHRQLDASITNPIMKALIIEARYCRDIRLLISEDQRLAKNQMNWYFGCRTMACVGGLVNHYLDSRGLMEKYREIDYSGLKVARNEACTSLALLYVIRCEAKMDTFRIGDRETIFRANPKILTRMRELLEQDELSVEKQHSRTKLFALFVGAYAEQVRALSTHEAPEKGWFNVELAIHAAKMRVWTWRDVREILLGFHYSDSLQPYGSVWFWKTMSANA